MMLYRSALPASLMWTLVFITCLCGLASVPAQATEGARADRLSLDSDTLSVPLGQHLEIYEDTSGNRTIDDILSAKAPLDFRPSSNAAPGFGFSRSAFWARTKITSAADTDHLWLLDLAYAPLQHVDVYVQTGQQPLLHLAGGSAVPPSERSFAHRTHVFPLRFTPGTDYTLYLRIAGESSLSLPLTLWRSDAFARMTSTQMYMLGAYAGIMIALVLYNIFIYLTVREPAYAYYIAYMIGFSLFNVSINGVAQTALWPDSPEWALRAIPFFIGFSAFFAALFTSHLLTGGKGPKGITMIIRMSMVLSGFIMALSLFGPYKVAIITGASCVAFWVISWMGSAIYMIRRGQQSAVYYLVAWIMLFFGSSIYSLKTFGLLPANLFTEYSMQIGSALEAVLLSVALAARMRALREENSRAQKRILEQEKMANLGLLSAGISHEINNPNNFLSVSAQTLEARLQDFHRELEELAEGDQDAIALFKRRFDDLEKQLGLIKQGSDRIKGIVKSMRAASRNDEKQEKCRIDPIDTLRNTAELVKPTYKEYIHFDASGLVHNVCIEGYSSQLAQVFTNLLVNACHAIEERQKHKNNHQGLITLASETEDDKLLIHITDNGCGMSEETQRRLFEPFFTTKGADKGTGLGMGICRGIIERHAGQLRIRSAAGEGTTMTLALPLQT
jgi:signal transduction histidine kinase